MNREQTDTTVVNAPQAATVNVNQDQVDDLVGSLPAVIKESKAGYRTTEFWVAVIGSLLTVLNGVPLPEKYEGVVVALFGAVYILSRGIAKKGVPVVEPGTPTS